MVPVEIIMTDEKHNPETEHHGVEGLTEVLRLQAEALSRISERMSQGQHSVPPPEHHEPKGDPAHLPVLARDPSLTEESLPVLNSFKKFLDEERQRGRKRMLWGLLGFTVVFSSVLAVIVWMNSERARELKNDIVQTKALSEQTRLASDAELKRLAEQTSQAATQNVSQLRKDITRNILWAHSMIASNMNSELTGRDGELERLKEKLSEVEIENAMLARQVAELGDRLKVLEEARDGRDLAAADGQPRDAVSAGGQARPAAPMTINSAKFNRSFQLRMPQE